MGFRDDDEALRQRAEALERDLERERVEKEQLRRQLEEARAAAAGDHELAEKAREQARKQAAEKRKRGKDREREKAGERPGKRPGRGKMIGLYILVGLGLALPMLAGFFCDTMQDLWLSGRAMQAFFVTLRGGENVLLLRSHVEDDRLDLVDLSTGKRLARERLGQSSTTCELANDDRVWCDVGRELELRELPSLKRVANQKRLISARPELAAAGVNPRRLTVLSSGAAVLTSNTGQLYSIDPSTLGIDPIDAKPQLDTRARRQPTSPLHDLRLEGRPQMRLVRGAQPFAPELTFLEARVLDEPIPGGFVVAHASSLDHDRARTLFTAVSIDGKQLWRHTTDARLHLEHAKLVGELLVIVTDTRVIALRARDGQLRWTYGT